MAPVANWLTLAEAADESGIPAATLRRWIHEGRLEANKVGPRMWMLKRPIVARLRRPKMGRPTKGKGKQS